MVIGIENKYCILNNKEIDNENITNNINNTSST